MSRNEILNYCVPPLIKSLLQTEDSSSHKLALSLSTCPALILCWADLSEWACRKQEIDCLPSAYHLTFSPMYEDGGLLHTLLAPLNLTYNNSDVDEVMLQLDELIIRLIDKNKIPYNEEIYSFLKLEVAKYTSTHAE